MNLKWKVHSNGRPPFLASHSLVETILGRRRKLVAVVVVMAVAEFPMLQCVDYSDGRTWGGVWFCSSVVVVLC